MGYVIMPPPGAVGVLPVGVWRKVAEVNVTADTSEVNFTGLDLNTHKVYHLVGWVKISYSDANKTLIYLENDLTNANYETQFHRVVGSSIHEFGTYAYPEVYEGSGIGDFLSFEAFIFKDLDGRVKIISFKIRKKVDGLSQIWHIGIFHKVSITNLTTLKIQSRDWATATNPINAIGAGSSFAIYSPMG